MFIDLYRCETSREFQALQTNMHITKDAERNLPSQNESKHRRSDTSAAVVFVRTSSDPPLPPPAAPPIGDVLQVSSATSVNQFRSLRCRVDAYVAHESLRHALPKLSFDICIAINSFLASASAPFMFHRVTERDPVTYVFSVVCMLDHFS